MLKELAHSALTAHWMAGYPGGRVDERTGRQADERLAAGLVGRLAGWQAGRPPHRAALACFSAFPTTPETLSTLPHGVISFRFSFLVPLPVVPSPMTPTSV